MPLLEIDHVDTFYGPVQALKSVSLMVEAGEIVTLVGANGAGKTTLLMTICGHPQAKSGQIFFDGTPITHKSPHEIARLGIGHAPEGRRIFLKMTVLENLTLGAYTAAKSHFADDLDRVLTRLPRLKERLGQKGGTLSGGEQQMLAIGRALMGRPRLLLLDEPSLGLAPLLVKQIFAIIEEINREDGVTILLVEQNAAAALKLAARGYVLVNGRVTLTGTGADLLANPDMRAAYLEGV